MKAEVWKDCCLVAKSCLTLSDPVESSLPASSVLEIYWAGTLEWVAISFSHGRRNLVSRRDLPMSPALAGGFFTTESVGKPWKV